MNYKEKGTLNFDGFSQLKITDDLSLLDKISVVLLAFSPILQHYKGFLYNAGVSVLAIILPYILVRIFVTPSLADFQSLKPVFWFVVYYLYRIFNHGTSLIDLSRNLVPLAFIIAFALGGISFKYFQKISLIIGISSSVVIVFQYLLFYLFKFHLQLVPTGLLLPESEQWILGAQTGLAGITGKIGSLYRPAAFFLEPSHMFLYLFPHILLLLFAKKRIHHSYLLALMLSLGLILSTSGMAIGFLSGAWFVYFVMYNKSLRTIRLRNLLITRNIIACLILVILAIVLYIKIPFINSSVSRILRGSAGSVSAISGRTTRGIALIRELSGTELWFGVSDDIAGINFNLPGLIATMYKYGLIGVVLSYMFFFQVLRRLDIPYVMMSGVIIVVSLFSAHTHGTFYMLYYVCLLLGGFQARVLAKTGSQWLVNTRRKGGRAFLSELKSL